jgi:hypothetical protein
MVVYHSDVYGRLNALLIVLRSISRLVQPNDITRTQYTKCRLCSAS